MKSFELFISLRYIFSNIKQSLIISGAVGIGVGIIIFVPSVNLTFFNDLIDKTVSSSPHITIIKEIDTFKNNEPIFERGKGLILLKDQTQTRKREIVSYKKVEEQIKNTDGIIAMAPYASGQGIVVKGAKDLGVSIKGIIPEKEEKVISIKNDIIRGSIEKLGPNEIIIGVKLAEKFNINMGNRVILVGPRGVTKSFKITGIFKSNLKSKDEGTVYVSLKSGQQLFQLGNRVNGLGIKIKEIYSAEKVAEELRNITGLKVSSWMEDNKQILDQLNNFKVVIAFINFLIVFAAASSITSVLIMLIASKTKEIGILKSMGAKNYSIMAIFIIQAALLGFIGYGAGLILYKIIVTAYNSTIPATETVLGNVRPPVKMNVDYAILAFIYSMISSLAASIIPAYQATKLNPVEAINA